MTPDETPPSREALAEEVAARLRASGLDAARDGDNVTVYEQAKRAAPGGVWTGRKAAMVLGVTLGLALLLLLFWPGAR
jgi:hypothetical protein